MRFINTLLVAIAYLAICFATPVMAQYQHMGGTMHEKMWNLRAGIFVPMGDTRSSIEPTIGIEHEHPAAAFFKGTSGFLSLSADFTGIKTTARSGIGEETTLLVPILINYKKHYMTASNHMWDYGAGVGVYWASDPIPDMHIDHKTQFAWQITAAYYTTPSWFLEGRFIAGTHPSNDGMFAAEIGYTF